MLASLALENYRGFKSLNIRRFARVNLIGGVNNAGKTGLLEAIYLLLQRDGGEIVRELPGLFRAQSKINDNRYFWRWLASEGSDDVLTVIKGEITPFGEITAHWKSHKSHEHVRLHFQTEQLFNTAGHSFNTIPLVGDQQQKWPNPEVFSPRPTLPVEDAQVYLRAYKNNANTEERIEELLKAIDERVKRVRALPDENSNQPILHIGLRSGLTLPAPQFGQGFNRLLRIYSAILAAEARVFLIDEMETGLHHSILPLFWEGLAALARLEGVQIFATTHSREAIFAAHRVFSKETNYDFAYHRLERDVKGNITAVTYDHEALSGADEANFEVR